MSLLKRFVNLWRGDSLAREFDDELRFHLEMRAEQNRRAGMTAADAEAEAARHLGAQSRAREGMREARVVHWLDTLARDVRYGMRLFMRQPGMTALAVIMLSLGIGANAVMFSVLYGVLFRPLPFPDADRLVTVVDRFRDASSVAATSPTVPELLDVRGQSQTLDISFYDARDFQISGGDEPARIFAARVDSAFLQVLGVRPQHGRLFGDAEGRPGGQRAVILSNGLWKRNFGADPAIVGRQIIVNSAPSTVLGVLPPGFAFDFLAAEPIEMFVPFPMTPAYASRTGEFANVRRVTGLARLKPGASLERASTELEAISHGLSEDHPELYRRGSDGQPTGFFMDVEPLRDAMTRGAEPVLRLLVGAVILVLLIACANTGQFLIARAIAREHEVAIRSALGAARLRLVRQFLTEALLLALAGAALGVLQALWLTDVMVALLPGTLVTGDVAINRVVLAGAGVVALVTTILFGLLPALRFSSVEVTPHLATRATAARSRSRQLLIGVEVAISVVLLIGAAVLTEGIRDHLNTPRGYSDADVTVLRMRISGNAGRLPHTGIAYQQYLDRISEVPGVVAAAVTDSPLPRQGGIPFAIEGGGDDAATLSRQMAAYQIVSPDYFSVVSIPLRAGRVFRADDTTDRDGVAIVNEAMAQAFWPGQSPLGQRIQAGDGPRRALVTIVGVVGDVRTGLQRGTSFQIYVSHLQQSEPSVNVLIRSAPGAPAPVDRIKQAIWTVFPDQPVFSVTPLSAVVSQWTARPRTVSRLLTTSALLALLMSITGIYTIVSYLVSKRLKEIALRRAIGATTLHIMKLLAGETLGWTAVGLAVGIAVAVAGRNILRATVPAGVADLSAVTIAQITLAYLVVIAIAISVPARRALTVDPATVLRVE